MDVDMEREAGLSAIVGVVERPNVYVSTEAVANQLANMEAEPVAFGVEFVWVR